MTLDEEIKQHIIKTQALQQSKFAVKRLVNGKIKFLSPKENTEKNQADLKKALAFKKFLSKKKRNR